MAETEGYSSAIGPEEVAFRHGGTRVTSPKAESHVLFCDGHVQFVTRRMLVDDPNVLSAEAAETGISWFQR
jgi:prepilin-type processing-associated H-X9-DG protein